MNDYDLNNLSRFADSFHHPTNSLHMKPLDNVDDSNDDPSSSLSLNPNHIKYPKIDQFRQVVKDLQYHVTKHKIMQTVFPLVGTVKLHGSHADIVFTKQTDNADDSLWNTTFQSRNRILSSSADNCGFFRLMEQVPSSEMKRLRDEILLILQNENISKDPVKQIMISGEICGGNVQKGVALAELPLMFVIYGIKINNIWQDFSRYHQLKAEAHQIYNISRAPIFHETLDLKDVDSLVPRLLEKTNQVDKECPFAKTFGVSGVGEGIVYVLAEHPDWTDFWFKVKGSEHTVSHVKTLKEKTPEQLNALRDVKTFVSQVVTEARLNQGLDYMREMQIEQTKSNIGVFIKWITADVIKEELPDMTDAGIDEKQISKDIAFVARTWYLKHVNK